jgi:hypothetical protein
MVLLVVAVLLYNVQRVPSCPYYASATLTTTLNPTPMNYKANLAVTYTDNVGYLCKRYV